MEVVTAAVVRWVFFFFIHHRESPWDAKQVHSTTYLIHYQRRTALKCPAKQLHVHLLWFDLYKVFHSSTNFLFFFLNPNTSNAFRSPSLFSCVWAAALWLTVMMPFPACICAAVPLWALGASILIQLSPRQVKWRKVSLHGRAKLIQWVTADGEEKPGICNMWSVSDDSSFSFSSFRDLALAFSWVKN